jgi:hypothetical protein
MLLKLKNLWNNYGFEIVIGLCILFLLLFGIINKLTNKKGTYSSKNHIFSSLSNFNKNNSNFNKNNNSFNNSNNDFKQSKGEVECRRVLETLFNRLFKSQRPDFLRNPVTGGNFNLELDCYNSDMKLAVEYNGIQHYKYNPYFHRNNEHFMNQKYRDDMKRRICKEHGITLIEVPYTVKLPDIKNFIINACKKYGYL